MTSAGQPLAPLRVRPSTRLFLAATTLVLGSCGGKEGNTPNILPTPVGTSTGAADDGVGPLTGDTAMETETGGGSMFPAGYRFDCIDIQIIGDGDGEAFQAIVLENAWTGDIKASKLNILLTVLERDDEAGTALLQFGSGIGPTASELCSQSDTATAAHAASYAPGAVDWQDARSEQMCSKDGAGAEGAGTYTFALGAQDVVYVYAEDDDGSSFNCVPGGAAPNAVPIRAVEATVTMAPGEQVGFGELTGCLNVAEATTLCSCIGTCFGEPDPACGECPAGSRPLAGLLQGINPSTRCTELMGEDSFDLRLGFVTEALGYVPEMCG